eukprot:6758265-Alexandrium_andersonii.AAC.1
MRVHTHPADPRRSSNALKSSAKASPQVPTSSKPVRVRHRCMTVKRRSATQVENEGRLRHAHLRRPSWATGGRL